MKNFYTVIFLICTLSVLYAQIENPASAGLIDSTDVKQGAEYNRGTIKVIAVPEDAVITLRYKNVEYHTADNISTFEGLPEGRYILAVEKAGYETEVLNLDLVKNQTITCRLNLQKDEIFFYKLWTRNSISTSNAAPLFKSAVIPGWGQISNNDKRGWLFMGAVAAAAGLYYSAYAEHKDNLQEYNKAKKLFNLDKTVANARVVNEAVAKNDDVYKNSITILKILGGLYAVNIIDALFFSSSRKPEILYSVQPQVSSQITDSSQDLMFGLKLNW